MGLACDRKTLIKSTSRHAGDLRGIVESDVDDLTVGSFQDLED
jgi:hypothetical protein